MPKDDRTRSFPPSGGPRRPPAREDVRILTPRQVYEHLDRYVIGQTSAKRAVATAAHQHLKRIEQRRQGKATLLRKSNLLLMGPTGSGKTHIARKLAELLEVPFTVVDATEYTEAGYYGKDVEVMVAELLFKSGHSIDATQRGIIFIDEVDKIARRARARVPRSLGPGRRRSGAAGGGAEGDRRVLGGEEARGARPAQHHGRAARRRHVRRAGEARRAAGDRSAIRVCAAEEARRRGAARLIRDTIHNFHAKSCTWHVELRMVSPFMLAYTFWHWPREGASEYERHLGEFFQALEAEKPPGYLGGLSMRHGGAAWLPGPAYLDWYRVSGFADLGTLNEGAVGGSRRAPDD